MIRRTRLLAIAMLIGTSAVRAADPENLGARPSIAPARPNLDQDGPPISRSDSFLRRGDLRILDPGPDPLDPPPRSRESWQRQVERDVDRVMGRIEPGEVFQLNQIDRDHDARRTSVFDRPREFERFEEERDRDLRIEQQTNEQAQGVQRERVLERESDRLRADRERFQRAMRTDTTSGAVAADARRLQTMRLAHETELTGIAKSRADALAAIDADQTLTPEQRTARRAETEQTYDRMRAGRIERYETDRATLSGFPREQKGGR